MLLALILAASPQVDWKPLQPGVEYRTFTLDPRPEHGDGLLHAVRVDPSKAALDLGLASEDGAMHTAAQWADRRKLSVVINAGMFELGDRTSSTGRLVHGAHVNREAWTPSYHSVLLFGPAAKGLAAAALVDRDAPGFAPLAAQYASLVQDLRLIKAPGASVWKPNGRQWSEAMIATDASGRLLFLFSRTPYQMAELSQKVLALPLGVVRAMHAEGGPEASLSIHTEDLTLDLCGSYETGFTENDANARQWELPNVLGVRAAGP